MFIIEVIVGGGGVPQCIILKGDLQKVALCSLHHSTIVFQPTNVIVVLFYKYLLFIVV